MVFFEDATLHAGTTLFCEHETRMFAETIAPRLGAGDTVLLSGQIGAGKTHFARCLIRALLPDHSVNEDIPSPTFTLVQTYFGRNFEIWHADLYRLTTVDEIYELGLTEAWTTALCLVEWPDRLGKEIPASAASLEFGLSDTPGERVLRVRANDPKWRWLTQEVREMAAKND